MVDLVEEWKDIEKHTKYLARYEKVGFYQLKKSDQGVEIRVCIGPTAISERLRNQRILNSSKS